MVPLLQPLVVKISSGNDILETRPSVEVVLMLIEVNLPSLLKIGY